MNKKGIIAKEVVRLVIALLCLVLLIFLAVQLYGIFSSKTEIQQAKSTLNQISEIMENLEEGESAEYLFVGPVNKNNLWFFKFFSGHESPEQCKGEDCLCICVSKNRDFIDANDCDNLGICKKTEKKVSIKTFNKNFRINEIFGISIINSDNEFDFFYSKELKLLEGMEEFLDENIEVIAGLLGSWDERKKEDYNNYKKIIQDNLDFYLREKEIRKSVRFDFSYLYDVPLSFYCSDGNFDTTSLGSRVSINYEGLPLEMILYYGREEDIGFCRGPVFYLQ
jgi:Tfp pilus assembly protein PilE